MHAYAIALVGGSYQLAGDLEWESGGDRRIPIATNDMPIHIKVRGDLPMPNCDTMLTLRSEWSIMDDRFRVRRR